MNEAKNFIQSNCDNITFAVNSGGILLDTPFLRLKSGLPGLAIYDQDNELMAVTPQDPVKIATTPGRSFAGEGNEISFSWHTSALEFTWRIMFHRRLPVAQIGATVRNLSSHPLKIAEIGLLDEASTEINYIGNPIDWTLSTAGESRRNGNLGEKMPSANEQAINFYRALNWAIPEKMSTRKYDTDGNWRCFQDFASLYTNYGNQGLTVAATGKPQAFVRLNFYSGEKNQLHFGAFAEMNGIILQPGQYREAQEIAIIVLPYQEAMQLAMRWIASTHGARNARKPVTGWCSWYSINNKVNADHVIKVAETATREGIKFDYIQIDDGWQKIVGEWQRNEKFADGWEPIFEKIRESGAQPGIWLAPLAVHEKTDLIKQHPEWFQHDADGDFAGSGEMWGPVNRWLDPTQPGAQEFIRNLIDECKAAGFRYFKTDFNCLDERARFHNPTLTRLQVFRQLYKVFRDAMGEESYLLACSGFTRGVMGYADAYRVGPDSNPDWYKAHYCCISECLKAMCSSAHANRILGSNDPDVTYLRTLGNLSEEEWRTWHSFVGILGGFTMISELINQPEQFERLRMLEIVTPPGPEPGLPLNGGNDTDRKLLGFLAKRPWGNAATVAVYNPDACDHDIDVKLSLTGIEDVPAYHVFSFWDEAVEKCTGDCFTARKLSPHGCKVLRITPAAAEPTVIGSTLHIGCGAAELTDFMVTDNTIRLVLSDAGAREGSIWLYSREILSLQSTNGLEAATLAAQCNDLWKLEVRKRQKSQPQYITLNRQ